MNGCELCFKEEHELQLAWRTPVQGLAQDIMCGVALSFGMLEPAVC